MTGSDTPRPYLVTEYMGHMFPTKIYDNEHRLAQHALRHAEIADFAAGSSDRAGAIGWCAFDYNTHGDFGTNDKICYHGVYDMFRNPKYAGQFYASQTDPKIKPVLEPATIWAFGERNIGGVAPLAIFSNCDEIKMSLDGMPEESLLPDRETYKNLAHPPFILREMPQYFWGKPWSDVTFTGIVSGKAVIERRMSARPVPHTLIARISHEIIGINDVARVSVVAADQCGNALKFLHETLHISVKGAANPVGPSSVVFQGGVYSFYIRAVKKGTVNITLSADRFDSVTLCAEVRWKAFRSVMPN
jgi:beta-galactosidase